MKINICSRRRGGDRDTREETEEECLELIKKNKENRSARPLKGNGDRSGVE